MALPSHASALERIWRWTYLALCTAIFVFLVAPVLVVIPLSFNAQMKDVAAAALQARGHSVEVSDLYAQDFHPAEGPRHFAPRARPERFGAQTEQRHAHEQGTTSQEVRREIARLERADFVLFQYPIWWFGLPAMLHDKDSRGALAYLALAGELIRHHDPDAMLEEAPAEAEPATEPETDGDHTATTVEVEALSEDTIDIVEPEPESEPLSGSDPEPDAGEPREAEPERAIPYLGKGGF